jgi:hypothetical protein
LAGQTNALLNGAFLALTAAKRGFDKDGANIGKADKAEYLLKVTFLHIHRRRRRTFAILSAAGINGQYRLPVTRLVALVADAEGIARLNQNVDISLSLRGCRKSTWGRKQILVGAFEFVNDRFDPAPGLFFLVGRMAAMHNGVLGLNRKTVKGRAFHFNTTEGFHGILRVRYFVGLDKNALATLMELERFFLGEHSI